MTLNDEETLKLRNAYKAVFSGVQGEVVLFDLFDRLCFMKPCENDEQRGRNNAAKEIVELVCGDEITENGSTIKFMNTIRNYFKRARITK